MKVLITGGLGFIGRHLCNLFLSRGEQVTAVGFRSQQNSISHDSFDYISADTSQKGPWLEALEDSDVVINLAGKTIFKRWTETYKQLIYDSRILTTRNLVEAMPENKEIVFCSTSATGYYGAGGENILSEDSPNGDDFLATVGRDWESEALRAEKKGIRVVITRFSIVLGQDGGIMAKMMPAFRSFLGGPLGDGRQWFPWMHMDDLLSAFVFLIENQKLRGAFNLCSPNPVRNQDFVRALGRVLKRPAFMPAPAFMIRLLMGELGAVIMCSQRAVPQRLLEHGFHFEYPDIEAAIKNIIHSDG
jgi:uncharacterized protein (TIGR01777 family)